MEGHRASRISAVGTRSIRWRTDERKPRFMPYADDTTWLLFAFGLGVIAVSLFFILASRRFRWASFGFLLTGTLVLASHYLLGSDPTRGMRIEINA